jgi:hypothetical protein
VHERIGDLLERLRGLAGRRVTIGVHVIRMPSDESFDGVEDGLAKAFRNSPSALDAADRDKLIDTAQNHRRWSLIELPEINARNCQNVTLPLRIGAPTDAAMDVQLELLPILAGEEMISLAARVAEGGEKELIPIAFYDLLFDQRSLLLQVAEHKDEKVLVLITPSCD